jgi:nucleotide-binding universal stress UspA family protein
MARRILCPVDLSRDSAEALRYALALVRADSSKLILCHCAESLTPGATATASPSGDGAREMFTNMIVEHMGYGDLAQFDWEGIVVEGGDPAEAITREAAARGVDLIVMRSRRRPRAAALLGSTAEAVCRTAPCPVLVTHPQEREWVGATTGEIDLRRVLVAYDFSDDSELALRQGLSLAQEYRAEVHLLHVLQKPPQDGPEISWLPSVTEGAYNDAVGRLRKAVPDEARQWCRVVHAVRWGKPYREVLSYADEHEIDLVCMGAKGAGYGMSALFGSNVDRVLRQASCPVLVARPLRPSVAFASASVSPREDTDAVSRVAPLKRT